MSSMSSQDVNFHLSKWYLDFTTGEGNAMIFYSAELKWHMWTAKYTSWLNHSHQTGTHSRSRFTSVQLPHLDGDIISWNDSKFGISGIWNSAGKAISTRLFESDAGYLDWNCYQPRSVVRLKIGNEMREGSGYAEQLILTALPWKIPMEELRWGRYVSDSSSLVWIEIREKEKNQWLWLNSEKCGPGTIENHRITIPEKELVLYLDRAVSLESEKKLYSVVGKLIRYLPGFNRIIPLKFLMADEIKWLSNGTLEVQDNADRGMVIHELVNFNPPER
jgi:hypothetical protein